MVFWNLGQSRATGASSRESDVMSLVEYEQSAGIGRLILNPPEAGNAVTPALIADLGNAVEAACATPIRALLTVARGDNFSLGGDVRHFAAAGAGVAQVPQDMATDRKCHMAGKDE